MKAKRLTLMAAVIIATLLFGNAAYALTTHAVIHISMRVIGELSLSLEDGWINQNFQSPTTEAFSELKEHDIYVDKTYRDNSTVWLFTKTE